MNGTAPQIWAIGGGKGGVGKSTLSLLLSFWLARVGKKTVLMDVDLGGANVHTLMGIMNPVRTLNDYIKRRYDQLEEICIDTEVENLRIICGAGDVLSMANPHVAHKTKIIQNIYKIKADFVVLDLGAGTSFNVLDFFNMADKKIVVLVPQPISIQNAYAFVRNAVYRKLSLLAGKIPVLQSLIKTTMDINNELRLKTVRDLLMAIEDSQGTEVCKNLQQEIENIKPDVITNMAVNPQDQEAGKIIQRVAEKYLMIHPVDRGAITYDKQLYNLVSEMAPITRLFQSSQAFAHGYDIAMKLMAEQN
jgi:flagellar biosynthesis protein FlhG